jgi:hypothetical protein
VRHGLGRYPERMSSAPIRAFRNWILKEAGNNAT